MMDAEVVASRPDRRIRRFSLAGLVVALPVAIVLHSDGMLDWFARHMASPVVVERGQVQPYGGARWRLAGLTRLQGELPGTALVVAEFEAMVDDPALLVAGGYCATRLSDGAGRHWLPQFLADRTVREALPQAAEKPRCGSFDAAQPGQAVGMAEVFLIPGDVGDLVLSVRLTEAPDQGLLFRSP